MSRAAEDLFVHQSSLKFDGYWSLNDSDKISIGSGNNGHTKAMDVIAPGGDVLIGRSRPSGDGDRGYGGGDRGYGGGSKNDGGGGGYACYKCCEEGHMATDFYLGNRGGTVQRTTASSGTASMAATAARGGHLFRSVRVDEPQLDIVRGASIVVIILRRLCQLAPATLLCSANLL